jgi:hypothetical protein
MGFYKLSILSSAFSHLMQIIKEPEKIVEMYGERIWSIEEKYKKISEVIPYLSNRVKTIKSVRIKKTSQQLFEFKKILKVLVEEDVGDIVVGGFSILVQDGVIKEILEKKLGKKIVDNRFVLHFVRNTNAGKEEKTRQQIVTNMEIQIKNYEFKVASLDLVGVYAYQDYMKDKQLNILTEFQKDGKLLKEIADQYFKEFIIIQGTQRRIRAIKYYEIGSKDLPILKEIKVF